MKASFDKLLAGYKQFRQKYGSEQNSLMENLAYHGQKPEFLVVSCCDSRVDPSVILSCLPGELFIVRNVANLIPPFECDTNHHGTSAALEFGICYLNVKHIIIWGHSQCGGIAASLDRSSIEHQNDFLGPWIDLIKNTSGSDEVDEVAKSSIHNSYANCLTFPWVKDRVENNTLAIHRWFFDIKSAAIMAYSQHHDDYIPLEDLLAEDSF